MKLLIVPLLIATLTGCNAFEEKLLLHKQQQEQIICSPPEATLCIGWKV